LSKYLPDTGTTLTYAQALASLRSTCPDLAARGCIGSYIDSRYVAVKATPYDPINRLPLSLFNNPGDLLFYDKGPNAGQLVTDTDQLSYHVDFRKPASRTKLINALLSELTSRKTAYSTQLVMFDNWIVGLPENPAGVNNYYPLTLADNISYLTDLSAACHSADISIVPNFGWPFLSYDNVPVAISDAQIVTMAHLCDGLLVEQPMAFYPKYWADTTAPPITPTAAAVAELMRRYQLFVTNGCPPILIPNAHESNQDALPYPNGLNVDTHFVAGAAFQLDGPLVTWPPYLSRYPWLSYPASYGKPLGTTYEIGGTTTGRNFERICLRADFLERRVDSLRGFEAYLGGKNSRPKAANHVPPRTHRRHVGRGAVAAVMQHLRRIFPK